MGDRRPVVVIDNYDSFVYNLVHYLQEDRHDVLVFKNDACSVMQIKAMDPKAIVLSPGPQSPNEAGICLELVRALAPTVPMVGICLGHQIIGQAFGGKVQRAIHPMHGRSSLLKVILPDALGKFNTPPQVGRYHSLIVDKATLPECLEISALSAEDEIMAFQHKVYPTRGYQFHPESILTTEGREYLRDFFAWSQSRQPCENTPVDRMS